MNIEKEAAAIRLTVTGILIAEYGLLQLAPGKMDLKHRIKAAIAACRKVQSYFLHHPDASEKTRKTFSEQFNTDELVMLTELIKTCFGMDAESISEIIRAIQKNCAIL